MTAPSTAFQIQRALVRTLRRNAELKAAISGMHEGFAPAKAAYPFLVYNLAYAPYDYLWDSVLIYAGFDLSVISTDSVEANNLDALVAASLHDASLDVSGQSTLICRRVADLKSADIDDEGLKYYQIGGTYEIWTDQPLSVLRTASATASAVLMVQQTATASVRAVIA